MKSLLLLPFFILPLHAAFLAESIDGDLSDDWQAPSLLTLEPGSNYVSGITTGGDPDLFTIAVPPGLELVEMRVAFYNFFIPGNRTFLGFQDGATLLQDPLLFTADSSAEISYLLFGEADQNRDMLGTFTPSPNASAAPLGPGSYAFWINEIEPEPVDYALEFVADFAPAPEPSTPLLVLLASLAALRRRQKGVRPNFSTF